MEYPNGGTYEPFRYVSNLLIVTNSTVLPFCLGFEAHARLNVQEIVAVFIFYFFSNFGFVIWENKSTLQGRC